MASLIYFSWWFFVWLISLQIIHLLVIQFIFSNLEVPSQGISFVPRAPSPPNPKPEVPQPHHPPCPPTLPQSPSTLPHLPPPPPALFPPLAPSKQSLPFIREEFLSIVSSFTLVFYSLNVTLLNCPLNLCIIVPIGTYFLYSPPFFLFFGIYNNTHSYLQWHQTILLFLHSVTSNNFIHVGWL